MLSITEHMWKTQTTTVKVKDSSNSLHFSDSIGDLALLFPRLSRLSSSSCNSSSIRSTGGSTPV